MLKPARCGGERRNSCDLASHDDRETLKGLVQRGDKVKSMDDGSITGRLSELRELFLTVHIDTPPARGKHVSTREILEFFVSCKMTSTIARNR